MSIKTKSLLLSICFSISTLAASNICTKFYLGESGVREVVLSDLVSFYKEILETTVSEDKQALILELKRKLSEIEKTYGPLVRLEFIERVNQLNKALENPEVTAQNQNKKPARIKNVEKEVKALTPQEIAGLEDYFKKDLGSLHTLDDGYFHNSKSFNDEDKQISAGSGVQWTSDERFVVFRNFENKSFLYDTEQKTFIKFSPKNGSFAETGHLWQEYRDGKTYLIDIKTMQELGPFTGKPFKTNFVDDYLVTQIEHQISSSKTETEFFYHSISSPVMFSLGKFYVISADRGVAVRKRDENFDVIDLDTGRVTQTFSGVTSNTHTREDQFVFTSPDKKTHFLYRVRDGKIFEIPAELKNARHISKVNDKIIFERWKQNTVMIYDLVTKKSSTYKDYSDVRMSPDGSKVLLIRSLKEHSLLIDLSNMKKTAIDMGLDQFSPNGEWLFKHGGSSRREFQSFYHIPTKTPRLFAAGFHMRFIGPSDLFIFVSPQQENKKTKVFVGYGITDPVSALEIGEQNGDSSPKGSFILHYEGKNVVLKGRPKQN